MLSVYICDDEELVVRQIDRCIRDYFIEHPMLHEISTFYRGCDLVRRQRQVPADIIFLDIELDKENGVQAARLIRQFDKNVKIIFVTGYRQFKGAAFSVRAFGYVDKPINRVKIAEQLNDVCAYTRAQEGEVHYKFDTDEGILDLPLSEVLYFESERRKIRMVTKSGSYVMKGKISALSDIFEPHDFASPHVSFLVNMNYVIDIHHYTVFMIDQIEIPLSQRKSSHFREQFNLFLSRTVTAMKGDRNV